LLKRRSFSLVPQMRQGPIEEAEPMELDLTTVPSDLCPELFLLAPAGVEAASSPSASPPTTAGAEAEGQTMSLHRLLASSGIEAGAPMSPEAAVKEATRNPIDLQGLRTSVEASGAPVHLRELLAFAGVERSGAPVNLNMLLASAGTDTSGSPINLDGSAASSGVFLVDKYQRTTLEACHSDPASSAVKVSSQVVYYFLFICFRLFSFFYFDRFTLFTEVISYNYTRHNTATVGLVVSLPTRPYRFH
jgi:hypothetical protein